MTRCSLVVLTAMLLLGACASTPRVSTVRSPEADFSRYATFAFHDPLGTDRDDGTGTILSEALKQATRLQLESGGYRYAEEAPDLRVNFFVETKEVIEGIQRPGVGFGYGIYHRHYGVWADYETDIRQFTEGSLHIDVVDAARDQLVWEGVAQQRLRDDDFTFELDRVRSAVQRVFAQFPRAE